MILHKSYNLLILDSERIVINVLIMQWCVWCFVFVFVSVYSIITCQNKTSISNFKCSFDAKINIFGGL